MDGAPTTSSVSPLAPAACFAALLDAEEKAARRADVAALLLLQDEKRMLVEQIVADAPDPETCRTLARRAGENMPLLRQLVSLHRGLLGADAPLYGPAGTLGGGNVTRRVAGRL